MAEICDQCQHDHTCYESDTGEDAIDFGFCCQCDILELVDSPCSPRFGDESLVFYNGNKTTMPTLGIDTFEQLS